MREQRDGAILGASPTRFTVAAFHSEETAAADLFERPSQFGLKDDRNRNRGSDDQQPQNRRQERQLEEIRQAKQADE